MNPLITIIIPTHNRCAMLLCALRALSCQTADPKSYEVIVVADGCQDNTAEAVKKLSVPYRLILIEQPSSGPAKARNRGAKEASAPLLMFLDDDIEPAPNLIESHLKASQKEQGGIILGYFPFTPNLNEKDLLSVGHRLWWSQQFSKKFMANYRFTFFDFITANVSIKRHLFDEVGGFDESFSAAITEDSELGLRLLKQRLNFIISSESISIHNAIRPEDNLFKRKIAEGQSHILLLRKHPEVLPSLPLINIIDKKNYYKLYRPEILFRLLWFYPILAQVIAAGIYTLLFLARFSGIKCWYYTFLGCLTSYYYWCGIRDKIGSLKALENLINTLQAERDNFTDVEVDLKANLKHLDNILAASQIDAMSLKFGDVQIGRIDPIVGAESLRLPHVHDVLINCFSDELLKVINPEINAINYDYDKYQVRTAHALILLAKLSHSYRNKLILFGPGWYLAESWEGMPKRWIDRRARLLYYSETECDANLKFQALSFYRPRTLEIYANDKLIYRRKIPQEFIGIKVRAHINKGVNIIHLLVPEGCERPCDHPEFDKNDKRWISLAIRCIELMPIV
jgi:GT2 family glycosyltransferase